MTMPNLIKGMHRSILDVCKDKWCLSLLALVVAIALNHVVFSNILVNRQVAHAQFVFGIDTIGSDEYTDAGIGQFTLDPLESRVEFSMIDNVNGHLYYGIEVDSGVTNRLAKIDKNTMGRIDTLDIDDYLIYSGVIDEFSGYIYLGIRNLTDTDLYRIAKVRVSDLRIMGYVTLDPSDGPAVKIPQIDTSNGYAYFMEGGAGDTTIVKIDIDPSRTFEKVDDLTTVFPDSLSYPHSSTIDLVGGKLYVANGQYIFKFDLVTFVYDAKLEPGAGLMHYMAGLDSALGYLYFQDNSPATLYRVNLSTFTLDGTTVALPATFSMRQNLPIDTSDPSNHYAYFGGGYSNNTIIKVNLSTSVIDDTLTLPTNQHNFPEGLIDSSYVYFATSMVPSFAIKVDLSSFTTDTEYRFPGGFKKFWSGVHDTTNGYLYYAVEGSGSDPYQIIKLDANTMTLIEGIYLDTDEKDIRTALIDEANEYAYFVSNDGSNPARVIRINIDPANFSHAGELDLSGGNGGYYNEAGVIDNFNNFAYVATGVNSAQRIHRINTDPGNFTWNSDGSDSLATGVTGNTQAVIDQTATYAYFTDNNTALGSVVKLELSSFTVSQVKTLGPVFRRMKAILLDELNGYIYVGQNLDGNLSRLNLADLSTAATISFPALYQNVYSAVIDPSVGYAYFFSIAYSSWDNGVIKVDIDPARTFEVVGASPLSVAPWHAMVDTDEAYIYLGSYERDLLKIPYTKKGKINAFKVTLTESADVIDYFEFYSHTADGNIRLAMYDSSKNLVWQSDAIANTISSDWMRVTPSTPLTNLAAGTYYLAYQTDSKESVASYIPGNPGDGFEINYDFGTFPSTITDEISNSETWSYYGQTTTIATRRAADLDATQNQPDAPADLTCEALSTDTIRWSFTDMADNETGFRLFDMEGLLWDSGPDIVTDLAYIDEIDLLPDTVYEDRYVTAYRGDIDSEDSNHASCTTLAIPEEVIAELPEGIEIGDLISPDNSRAVYYINSDLERQSFPSTEIYYTWFKDFSRVKQLSADIVGSIPLGPNATYRAGTYLIKIQTDPRVYVIEPQGVIRWITSGPIAEALYGTDWEARVMDVEDRYFTDYIIGEDLAGPIYPTGSLIQYSGSSTNYYIENGARRSITPGVFAANNFQTRFVITGVNPVAFSYPDGEPFPQLEDFILMTFKINR